MTTPPPVPTGHTTGDTQEPRETHDGPDGPGSLDELRSTGKPTRDVAARVRANDTEALAGFFQSHFDRLWRMVHFRMDSRLTGRVDPDDVLQEGYLDAAKRINHFQGDNETSLFIWLRMVIQQTMIDVHRRHLGTAMRSANREVNKAAAHANATSVSLTFHLLGHLTSPSAAAVRAEMTQMVEEALEGMDTIDREVLALRHFEELTNSEVAEALEIKPKTASIRYVRAISRLKGVLGSLPGFLDGTAADDNA